MVISEADIIMEEVRQILTKIEELGKGRYCCGYYQRL